MICPACRQDTGRSVDRCLRCGQPLDASSPDIVMPASDDVTRVTQAAPPENATVALPARPPASPSPDIVMPASDDVTRVIQAAPPENATVALPARPPASPPEIATLASDDVTRVGFGMSDEGVTVLAPAIADAAPREARRPSPAASSAPLFRLSQSPAPPDTPPPLRGRGTATGSGPTSNTAPPTGRAPSGAPPSGGAPLGPLQPALEDGMFGGRYRIVRLLGAGGMGEVYEAFDEELGERVALKVIRREFAQSADADARFRRELSVARQVTHRNVVRIHDLGVADGRKFISMSFVDGEDLAAMMARGRLPRDQALSIAEQLCAGLSAAHEAGIVHRDLKPGNIMVDGSGRAYLMDFGLARSIEETQYTQAGMVLGTVDYMSPEQATGEEIDHRSDIYSLGLILYEMLAGERPFRGDTSMSRLTARLHKPVPDPRVALPDLEPYLANLVLRCLERDPARRYQTVDEVLADLTAQRADARRLRRLANRPPSWWKTAAMAALVVLMAGAAALLFLPRGRAGEGTAGGTAAAAPQVSLAIVPFRNASGDRSLDWLGASLGEMLGADVGQSATVRTVSSARLQQILQDLAVPADGTIDPATLRRLAEFSNADTVVWGQYVRAGEQIRIDTTLQDFKQARSVPLTSEVTTEKDVLAAVDRLARSIRSAVTTSPDAVRELGASAFKPSSSSVPAVRAYTEGVQLARRGDHQEAAARLAESVRADPAFALAHSQLALSYASLGQEDQAEDASRRAVQLSANLPPREKYLIQANHARILNDNQQAIQAYEQLARMSPDDPDVQFALAGLREGTGSLDEARKGYENVLARDPKHVDALLSMGRVHIKQGNPQASLDFLNRALSLSIELNATEEKGRVLHAIGVAYKRLNKPEEALRYYQEALAIRRGIGQKNGVASTLTEMADMQKTLGRPAEALASYKEALELQREIGDRRGTGTTALSYGSFLVDRGTYDEALKLFREALQVNRDSGDEAGQALSLNNIGAVYFSKGQYEDALTYFQQALQLREKLKVPSDIAETVHNLGEASARTGQFDEAVTHYLRALELYRGASDKLNVAIESDAIGGVFQSQGRYGASLNVKTEALKNVREAGESGYWLATLLAGYGQALTLVGRGAEADKPLAEALGIARGLGNKALLAQVALYRGDRLFYAGDPPGAARLYREAAQSASGLSDERLRLAAGLGEARAAVEGGRASGVVAALKAVSARSNEMGLKDLSAESALYLGQALLAGKDHAAARRQLQDALSRAERLGMRGLQARSHYLLALALKGQHEEADAARHLSEARRLVAEMTAEARSDGLAGRSDFAPILQR